MRSKVGLAAAALAMSVITACDPPPPTPQFTVTTFDTGSDFEPGDGTCDDGTGHCTVQAAFDEANALGRGHIFLPPGEYDSLYTEVTAHITVEVAGDDPTDSATVGGSTPGVGLDIHVLSGGALVSMSVEYSGGPVTVDGALVGDRFASVGGAFTISPGGSAVLRNALVGEILNSGQLHLIASTLYGPYDDPALTTLGSGQSSLAATAVMSSGVGVACDGNNPVSLGHNMAADSTCGLAGPGDVVGDPTGNDLLPDPGSSRIDGVPVGVHGCGTGLVIDISGNPRPMDGDGDGTATCDIGAWERLHWS